MAVTNKFTLVFCMLLISTLLIHDLAECSSRGAALEILHRKLFLEMKEMALKNGVTKMGSYGDKEMPEDWELRRVPAGPDPLHHNGQGPNKPKTP
ncbi:hypothetical protein BUALT_Bualt02G0021600 [Buddleja alternifolia]|uniref:Uncharacterized protein n=1 Tax=Buddleja alternifolia TaxID=168488 RepID=A0AAV6Y106_9LAMI|nr:hypothetical protein BUALT_Bualt02G0021600 [Buddleja alternifolia]